jgi:hypothetical protein
MTIALVNNPTLLQPSFIKYSAPLLDILANGTDIAQTGCLLPLRWWYFECFKWEQVLVFLETSSATTSDVGIGTTTATRKLSIEGSEC